MLDFYKAMFRCWSSSGGEKTTGIILFVLMLEILLGRGYECLPVVSLQSQFATSGFAAYRSRFAAETFSIDLPKTWVLAMLL